ncbi:MAG: zinc-ribbon and FHA domain-containing protein [Actinobacteria bacterium]|nr:zinc-ribbon and FHA domain-containing protein [Actinomycetota bacterium]MBV8958028.1 zinc-ribbon and FHA domain-containing protein [Actinomycetota bacterium]MBV9253946.1 zinc-ribbon and FHA domain-containing protein [Actinomycetota bacterium]MBV9664301.1 zinc-ribbon and FHA domain-containing protein [Actinomycetota bacterium]
MADVFCNNCGHRNPSGANFCSSCGAPLEHGGDDPTTVTLVPVEADVAPPDDEIAVTLDDLPEGMGMLVVKRGPNAGSKFLLDADVTRAGRHPDSDIFLDDITVSRRHAEFARDDGGYLLRDVGSLNGTYLNRERIDDAPLANGDEVQIGKFKLVFLTGVGPEE